MHTLRLLLILLSSTLILQVTADESKDSRQLLNFIRRSETGRQIRSCTTPNGNRGKCQDVRFCPQLLGNFRELLRSLCFQDFFVPGTCCPIDTDKDDRKTTARPTTTTTTTTTTESPVTKKKPVTTAKPKFTRKTTAKTTTTTPRPSTKKETPPKAETTTQNSTTSTTTVKPYKPGISRRYECGVSRVTEARVVNGTESHPGKWPWMAAIYLHGFLSKEFHCGGTIISSRYILTAAHCTIDKRGNRFSPSQLSVRLGDHDISAEDSRSDVRARTYKVESITVHPDFENFSHQYFKNDMALLKLSKAIEFSSYIVPVCLPSKAMISRSIDYFSGYMGTVIGYGRTSYSGPQSKKLLEADMPIWWNGACDDAYFPPILDSNVCAGYVEGGIDSCQGDSGGPLLLNRNGKWVQLGIVSFGQRCAEPGYPGVYTRVTKFVSWIKNNI